MAWKATPVVFVEILAARSSMKRDSWLWIGLLAACGLVASFRPSAVRADVQFFVAIGGDDASPGTKEQPFASLEAARDAVRKRKASGSPAEPVTVWVRGGAYPRTAAFELKAEDSGTEAAPVQYRAWPGEVARLVGGRAGRGPGRWPASWGGG
jgi:hypothetical protein